MADHFLESLQGSHFGLFEITASPIVSKGRSFTTPASGRSNSGFIFVIQGRCQYRCLSVFALGAGDLAYLPEGGKYVFEVLTATVTYTLINFVIRDAEGRRIAFSNDPIRVAASPASFYRLKAEALVKACHSGGSSHELQAAAILYEILAQLASDLQVLSLNSRGYAGIAPAVMYLEQHYMEDVQTMHLARMCRLSESQFRRIFTRCKAITPMAYKNQLRIRQAHALLASGAYTVSEISEQLGFCDIFYFSSLFKKLTGFSPREIRAKQFQA